VLRFRGGARSAAGEEARVAAVGRSRPALIEAEALKVAADIGDGMADCRATAAWGLSGRLGCSS
jgi:hypothetical protein